MGRGAGGGGGSGERRDLAELALERRGDQRLDGVRARAGKLRRHLHGGKVDLRQRGDRQQPVAEPAAEHHGDAEQRGRDRPQDEGRGDGHRPCAQVLGPRRWRRGSVEAEGTGVSSGLPTATLAPSNRRAKPVVTTCSPAVTPPVTTACTSSCCDTVTGLTVTDLSSFTT